MSYFDPEPSGATDFSKDEHLNELGFALLSDLGDFMDQLFERHPSMPREVAFVQVAGMLANGSQADWYRHLVARACDETGCLPASRAELAERYRRADQRARELWGVEKGAA